MSGNGKARIFTAVLIFFLLFPGANGIAEAAIEEEKAEAGSWLRTALRGFSARVPEGVSAGEWKILGSFTLPLLKIMDTKEEGRELQASILTAAGVGFSICYIKGKVTDGEEMKYRAFSFSPCILLLSGSIEANVKLDVSWAATVGFLNEMILIGVGRDFGKIEGRRSRWFLLFGLGITLPGSSD